VTDRLRKVVNEHHPLARTPEKDRADG